MWLNKIKPVRYCLIYCSHKVTAWLLLRSGILSDDKFPPQILSTFLSIRTDMSFVVVSSQTFIEFPNFSVSLLLFYSQLLFKYKHFLFILLFCLATVSKITTTFLDQQKDIYYYPFVLFVNDLSEN